MFENIRMRWQEARAACLKEEFLDASRRLNSLTEEAAEHFAKTLDYASRYWITKHSAVKECSIELRRSAVKRAAISSQAAIRKRHWSSLRSSCIFISRRGVILTR